MGQVLREPWAKYWNRLSGTEVWGRHVDEILQPLPSGILAMQPITMEDVQRALARMKSASALGADAWAVDELGALPESALEALAGFQQAGAGTGE